MTIQCPPYSLRHVLTNTQTEGKEIPSNLEERGDVRHSETICIIIGCISNKTRVPVDLRTLPLLKCLAAHSYALLKVTNYPNLSWHTSFYSEMSLTSLARVFMFSCKNHKTMNTCDSPV